MVSNFANTQQPDPGLARSLWQGLCLGVIACALLFAAGEGRTGIGSAAWLVVLPLVALAAAYRHRLTMTFVLRGGREARASVRLPSRGARNASDHQFVPGRRAARQQRRSQRNEHRPEPVAGRR